MARLLLAILAAMITFGGSTVRAQTPTGPPTAIMVRVNVTDSTGAPVSGADVSVTRGLNTVLAHALTDVRGDQSLRIQRGGEDQLIVRKIGFSRVNRFFDDSIQPPPFRMVLAPLAQTLAAVKVTADEDVRRNNYFIDADAIEQSPRFLEDALDIVMKLRPDMIWGRQGRPDRIDQHVGMGGKRVTLSPQVDVAMGLKYGYCPPVANIWVNGARIRDVAIDPMAAANRTGLGVYINPMIATVLASIKPEHIATMEYHPCTDAPEGAPVGSSNAIMVQLKDGIGFEPGAGSYVLANVAASVGEKGAGAAQPQEGSATRILGVFDTDTGRPIAGAKIIDVASGTFALTTQTGTVSLGFLPEGQRKVSVERTGYTPLTIQVSISPRDSVPITVVMSHSKLQAP